MFMVGEDDVAALHRARVSDGHPGALAEGRRRWHFSQDAALLEFVC